MNYLSNMIINIIINGIILIPVIFVLSIIRRQVRKV